MANFSRDPILLTPGPLTTALPTRMAMLRDWGSWDSNFNAVTAVVRERVLAIVNLDEAGEIGAAAAMATLIVATSTAVCIVYALLTHLLLRRTQGWRAPPAP